MKTYLFIVATVLVLGVFMEQRGNGNKKYIILMAALHTFVCGFRYMYLTGDLIKYSNDFFKMQKHGWLSEEVFHEGRNTGFFWLMKLVALLSGNDYQFFLFIIALAIEIALAILVVRYSPMPWMSYLVWNCIGFYVFGFSAIKQALAMSVLMFAMDAIIQEKPRHFLIITLIAGLIHFPALVFLPAYWIAKVRISPDTIIKYILVGAVFYVFRERFINYISTLYYEEEEFALNSTQLGGRFFMVLAILVCGIILKGFQEENFSKLFNIIAVAAMLQMLSGFGHIFTRLTDYYFQFSVLYIPMLFTNYSCHTEINREGTRALLPFNERSRLLFSAVVALVLLWFYYNYVIGVEISYAVDDYTNFRFMWDVPKG